jgi:mono/diheme cytochrome c family protein
MRRLAKGLGITVLVLLVLAVIAISATIGWRPFLGPRSRALTDRKFEETPERQKRGAYLAEHVAGCTDCHTPSEDGLNGPETVPAKKGSGQIFRIPGFPGTLVAPNITPDPETGVGTWTDDQLARAIREGISHDGHTLFPMMPYSHFRRMSDEDLASVVVYLRSLPPLRSMLPPTNVDFPVKYLVRSVPEPVTEVVHADLTTPVSRGKYLVDMSVCGACHTVTKRGQPLAGMGFAGGDIFELPTGKVASPNITPDPTGIGNYTEETFIKVMRTGYVGTRQLNTMMPWQFYSGQTDEDLKAIYAYLKTLPPVSHHVDNSKPPRPCRKCGAVHGAGDAN